MRPRVLVVEDDPLNAKFFEFTLARRCGCEVELSEDVERILERVRSGKIHLVIMDISLANSRHEGKPIDGSDICRLIKQDPRSRRVPVLLATAHAMKGAREGLLLASGADDYISKPITDPAELVEKVQALLAR